MVLERVKYNPAFLSEDKLVESFVVRHAELDLIVGVIRENLHDSNQHVLVTGPRGSGKTSLALRAAAEVRRDEELRERWYPLVFAEESYQVGSPGEFWLEALFHLHKQTGDERWRRTYEELLAEGDEVRLRERTLAQLMDFADAEGKRILLIVENFKTLIGDQFSSDDAWTLRHTLINEPRIMLLATAISRFQAVDDPSEALFELFRPLHLRALNEDECRTLWTSITEGPPPDGCIRPIQILTGGNPRLLAIISSFGARLSFKELMEDLTQLVDEHTEYFKSHLDRLPPTERKAYLALAELWDPATAREVAGAARLEVSKVSALLNRLIERGAVAVADERKRTKTYQVAERMYNIYYLMRRRGVAADRVKAAVNFMIGFYGPEELSGLVVRIVQEARDLNAGLRREHFLAVDMILKKIPSPLGINSASWELALTGQEAKVVDSTTARTSAEPAEPDVEFQELLEQAEALSNEGQYDEAERLYRQAIKIDAAYARAWARLGQLLFERLGRYEEAEEAYQKAIELDPEYAWAWAQLGRLLHERLERYEEAEAAYRKAIEIDEEYAWAWASLGSLLHHRLERYEEAEAAYRKGIELKPEYAWCWAHLGRLLHERLQRYEEAEAAYRKAIEIDGEYAWAWASLGSLLHHRLERYDEAEAAYRKGIELKPEYAWCWAQLGSLLHERLERYEEAEAAYRKGIEIDGEVPWFWGQLGILLHERLGRYEEAEAAYRKALDLEPVAGGWGMLGQLLHERLERYEEAEAAYRKAIELEPEWAWAWGQLGSLLQRQLQRYDEAEGAYRKALDLEPVSHGWAMLGQLLRDRLGRAEEAEAAYRKAIEIDADNAWLWVQLGSLLHDRPGRYDEAEAAYRKAIQLNPEYPWAWDLLGTLLREQLGRDDEAEAAYRKAIEIDADNAWLWVQLGSLLHDRPGRYDEAEAACRKAVEIDAENPWGWVQLGLVLHNRLGRYEEAEAAYRRAIEIDGNHAWAWADLGRVLCERPDRSEEGEAAYRRAIQIDAEHTWAWALLGQLLHECPERYQEAEAAYRKAIEVDGEFAWAWFQLGSLLQDRLHRFEEAETAYRKAIDIEPDMPLGWLKLGSLLHIEVGHYEEAEEAYRRAIELAPRDPAGWLLLGLLLHERLARYQEAEAAYRKAIEIDKKHATAWGALGRLFHDRLGRHDQAEAAFRQAIEIAPHLTMPRLDLISVLLSKSDGASEAVRIVEQYLIDKPDDAAFLNNAARCFFEAGRADCLRPAQQWALRAVGLEPNDGNKQHTLASILCALGEAPAALAAARKYLEGVDAVKETVDDAIDLFVMLAAAGHAREALGVLRDSPSAPLLEPLVVGLRLFLGEDVKVAVEIREVAEDVVEKIRTYRPRFPT